MFDRLVYLTYLLVGEILLGKIFIGDHHHSLVSVADEQFLHAGLDLKFGILGGVGHEITAKFSFCL